MIARLHPLLVHLPLGILLVAAGIALLPRERAEKLQPALSVLWFLGAASAVIACATGWFSAQSMGQDPYLPLHQWLGIGTAVLASAVWFFREKFSANRILQATYASATLVFALATMHIGATLTHGEGYLFTQKGAASAVETTENGNSSAEDLPTDFIQPGAPIDIQMLVQQGVETNPVAAGSNYLSVNCTNAVTFSDSLAKALERLAPQIVWLKMSGTAIGDSTLIAVGKLPNLTRLHLDGTKISDSGLAHLVGLKKLRLLNLAGTDVTMAGLAMLRDLPDLRKMYLFQTGVKPADWPALREVFPNTMFDTGGYRLETLPTDTARLRAK